MTTIRLITHADIDAVLALHDENCLESAGHRMDERTRRNVEKMFTGYVDNLLAYAYVAKDHGRIVGYFTCAITHHPAMPGALGVLEDLYVMPEYRRRGIATQLVTQATDTLRESGKAGVLRAMVCVDAPGAQAFWASLGYENDMTAFSWYGV